MGAEFVSLLSIIKRMYKLIVQTATGLLAAQQTITETCGPRKTLTFYLRESIIQPIHKSLFLVILIFFFSHSNNIIIYFCS